MPTRMYIEKDGLEAGTPQGASELKAMLGATLSVRERWLVEKAFDAGAADYYVSEKYWLEDVVADCGVTVELALCKDAPND